MKIKFLLSLVLLGASLCYGQGAPGISNYPATVNPGTGAPSGNCPGINQFYLNITQGNFYTCPVAGSPYVLSGNTASGSGSISGLTSTQIPIAGSATTLTSSVAAPAGTIVGTSDTQVLTNKDLTSGTNTFGTLNQNTTGTSGGLTGTPNISIGTLTTSSSSNVANLNASTLNGATFAAPGTIGGTTPSVVFASNTIIPYALDTGAANALAVTVTGLPTAIATGLCVNVKAANTQTNTATLNVTPSGQSAYGAIAINKRATTGMVALGIGSHDIIIGNIYKFCYDGTVWELESTSGAVNTSAALGSAQVVTGNGGNQVTSSANLTASAGGAFTNYNGEATGGLGIPYTRAATSQKSETTTADANVLTVTPASAAGTYRACVVVSVSAATSGVISWTLSWTDSNGNAQSNIAQDLYQQGTAAPNTTFTSSSALNYNGCSTFDVNNAGANIVVKWVGGGTTTAKMSAVIERLQ